MTPFEVFTALHAALGEAISIYTQLQDKQLPAAERARLGRESIVILGKVGPLATATAEVVTLRLTGLVDACLAADNTALLDAFKVAADVDKSIGDTTAQALDEEIVSLLERAMKGAANELPPASEQRASGD